MNDFEILYKIVFSIGIGFLIGLEREYKAKEDIFAGIRTFPLISLLGTISAFVSDKHLELAVYIAFIGIILFTVVNFYLEYSKDRGITTEISVIITFILGVFIYYGYYYISGFMAIFLMFLLAVKKPLEDFAKHLYYEDIISIVKFLMLTALMYPILPDNYFGPFGFFNPKEAWKAIMVVATIDFLGYMLLRWKKDKSLLMVGLLGGLVSSTAVTYNFSKLSQKVDNINILLLGILLSWLMMNLRVIFLIGMMNPALLKYIFFPFFILTLIYLIIFYLLVKKQSGFDSSVYSDLKYPFSIISILQFAGVYIVIFLLAKMLIYYYGNQGLITLSVLSGVIDVDAIVISSSTMEKSGNIYVDTAVLSILTAVISNTVFKYIYIYIFASATLKRRMFILTLLTVFYLLFVEIFYIID